MDSASRRVTRLQRQILRTIRAEMRRTLGVQAAEIARYRRAYDREFRGRLRHSTKEALVKDCLSADIVLIGDYHTFAQSQKAALRLLRSVVSAKASVDLALGLEMVPSKHQAHLESYVSGQTNEATFLGAIDYALNWGFPWSNFKPLLDFAREHQLPVLALNTESENLEHRDEHAGRIIAEYSAAHPSTKLFVLYGDLHLARTHIPREITRQLKPEKRRLLTIFQNSEIVYWKVAHQAVTGNVDVVKLGTGRYCILNAPPWVKLQSYLDWAEGADGPGSHINAEESSAGEDMELEMDMGMGAVSYEERILERMRNLGNVLDIKSATEVPFTVHTVNDLSFIARTNRKAGTVGDQLSERLNRAELKALKHQILSNRNAFVPGANFIYLASPSINALAESAALLLHSSASGTTVFFHDPEKHFFGATLRAALAYFGSKLLNHKRKCDLENDFRAVLELPLRHAKKGAQFQRQVAKLTLRHLRAQRGYLAHKPYRLPRMPHQRSSRSGSRLSLVNSVPLFLETARSVGFILGEQLYSAYIDGRISNDKVKELFANRLDNPKVTKSIFLRLLTSLQKTPLAHSSKLDLF